MDPKEMLTSWATLSSARRATDQRREPLRELRPIVTMDIMMPDLDGIAAAKVLTEERIARPSSDRVQPAELVDGAKEAGSSAASSSRSRRPTAAIGSRSRFREFRQLEKEAAGSATRSRLGSRRRAKGV
jgi:response regulator NasT